MDVLIAATTADRRADDRRLIELDDNLLQAARHPLHTKGVSDTARRGMLPFAAQRTWLTDDGLEPLAGKEERHDVWR